MGFSRPSLEWNAGVLPTLSSGMSVQATETPHILTIDFPRLLCSIIYRENYCSGDAGLVNSRIFHYQWSIFTP
jgi:hypothetical protein